MMMDKQGKYQLVLWAVFLLATVLSLWISATLFFSSIPPPKVIEEGPSVTIATWNLQIFGKTKAENTALMQTYADILDDYDIAFVQEIRENNGTAFQALCARLPEYTCDISTRAGRSNSKEQYGLLYRNMTWENESVTLLDWRDYTPDDQDRWERPPLAVTFRVHDYVFTLYTLHTKPADVEQELVALENLIDDKGNVVVLGDLNADCSYYRPDKSVAFSTWQWVIRDSEDTTVAKSECTYDRILLNTDASREYLRKGIVTEGINTTVSDHYLVWVMLRTREG